MKRRLYVNSLFVLFLVAVLSSTAFALLPKHKSRFAKTDKTAVQNQFTMTGNRWAFEMTNYGSYAQDISGRLPRGGGAGGQYPQPFGPYVIFAAGIQIGALVNGVPTVSVVDFDSEFQPGALTKTNATDTTEVPIASEPGSVNNKLFALYGDGRDGTPSGNNGDDIDDRANWPSLEGAPVKPDGSPLVIGDLMSWCVYNDMDSTIHRLPDESNKTPLGLEIQQTSFQINVGNYSDVFFMYYKIINKGTKHLHDTYVASWFDADVDDASNDLIATDTLTNMVFAYNSDNSDQLSQGGSAFGADFFQGPVVAGDPTDTAKYLELTENGFVQHVVPGKKTLSLSTTVRYINVRGPSGDPDNDAELYNLMQGLEKNGDPKSSRFTYPEDPITGNSANLDPRPDDKRMMLCTGPFNLAVGDTQIVVLACIGGAGKDRLDAIKYLRANDEVAQKAYDALFVLPLPPPSPNLTVTPLDGKVALQWDNSPEVAEDPYGDLTGVAGYTTRDFAGYKVYRSPDGASDWKLLAQFDKNDGITVIPETTWVVQDLSIKTLTQTTIGNDGGLKYSYIDDEVTNGQTYYYAVTSYDAQPNIRSGTAPITLEGVQGLNSTRVVPRKPTLGNSFIAGVQDTATHIGKSDGSVFASVVDPTKVTGHTYKVIFKNVTVTDTISASSSDKLLWQVFDIDINNFVPFNKADDPRTDIDERYYQENQGSFLDPSTQQAFVTVDGLLIKVFGPAPDFKNFETISNANGVFETPDYGAFNINGSGFPDPNGLEAPSENQQVGGGNWGIHTADNGSRASYEAFVDRTARGGDNWPEIVPYDFEIRFTADGGWAFDAYNTGTAFFHVPFELWNIGIATPNDTTDDYRLIPYLLDDDGSLTFNMGAPDAKGSGTYDHSISGGDDDPYTDWIYWMRPQDTSPGQAGYLAAEAEMIDTSYTGDRETEVMARMVLINKNGDIGATPPSGTYNQDLPETGTIFRLSTTKPNAVTDTFVIHSTAKPGFDRTAAAVHLDKQHIKVVPNPYYGFSSYDQNQFNRRVKITGLPDRCTIRIFNVAGDLIRTINHEASSNNDRSADTNPEFTSIEIWDLSSDKGLFVTSGMYFLHIDAPGIGQSKDMIPFAIIQGSVQLTVPTN